MKRVHDKPPSDCLPLRQPGESQAEKKTPKEQETEKKETTQKHPLQVRRVSQRAWRFALRKLSALKSSWALEQFFFLI